jgi:peptidoglycan hydrolase-like protein with peptidoglycan-binding domain
MKKVAGFAVLALAFLLCFGLAAAAGAGDGFPAPSGPGDRGGHVMRLQEALIAKGCLSGETTGVYAMETLQAVAAFQADRGLKIDGRAGIETLRLLFAPEPKPTGTTEMPHWFRGGSGLIPWGARFEVKDVLTGAIFACQRMEGFAHIDAEPLTPVDTQTMLGAYHGKWSWDRRPILISFEGRVFAASMNGMPHGFSSIKDNKMPGHFCIHLFFSRNHGNGRVNPTHLESVVLASKEIWGGTSPPPVADEGDVEAQ